MTLYCILSGIFSPISNYNLRLIYFVNIELFHPLCAYSIIDLSILLLIHLGYFQDFVIINNITVNIFEHVSWYTYVRVSGNIPRSGICELQGMCTFRFTGNTVCFVVEEWRALQNI